VGHLSRFTAIRERGTVQEELQSLPPLAASAAELKET
jgi:hypothetical protein